MSAEVDRPTARGARPAGADDGAGVDDCGASVSAEVHRLGVAGLAAAFRARELRPVEAVEAFLERIAALDGEVGAFITVTAEEARREARAAERALARPSGRSRPLLGVPIAVKDLVETRGVRTTAASAVLADHVPERDATVWRRLRRAGAVLIGKANTHEFAYGGTSEPTRNPWSLEHMVGGSSGGSAAALAAGMCAAAIGSDSAGSIRIPAGFCGVYGLKPSWGVVSRTGVIPLAPSFDTVGPLARSPVDLGLLLDAMAGYDRADEGSARRRWRGSAVPAVGAELPGLRVGLLSDVEPMSAGVRAALRSAAAALEAAGAIVVETSIGDLDRATELCFEIMAVEAADFHERWLGERPDDYSPYVRERIGAGLEISGVAYRRALAAARAVAARCDEVLSRHDVLLGPGMPCPAPVAYVETMQIGGRTYGRDYLICRNTAFANVAGIPALAVPGGLEDGLPVGVQVFGPMLGDPLVLRVGEVLHRRLGWCGAPADLG